MIICIYIVICLFKRLTLFKSCRTASRITSWIFSSSPDPPPVSIDPAMKIRAMTENTMIALRLSCFVISSTPFCLYSDCLMSTQSEKSLFLIIHIIDGVSRGGIICIYNAVWLNNYAFLLDPYIIALRNSNASAKNDLCSFLQHIPLFACFSGSHAALSGTARFYSIFLRASSIGMRRMRLKSMSITMRYPANTIIIILTRP